MIFLVLHRSPPCGDGRKYLSGNSQPCVHVPSRLARFSRPRPHQLVVLHCRDGILRRIVPCAQEKERYVSSVIEVLEANPNLCGSAAHIYALAERAQARLDVDPRRHEGALDDAMNALTWIRRSSVATATEANRPKFYATAFRVAVDVQVQAGNYEAAASILREWDKYMPSYQTKILKELRHLQETAKRVQTYESTR
jgi:hypothetical protein